MVPARVPVVVSVKFGFHTGQRGAGNAAARPAPRTDSAEPAASPRIFSPTDSGRSRRPCPQPQPRGRCRGLRGLRAPRDRRRWGGSRFWGGQKEEVWEPRFSAQPDRRIPRRVRACRWCRCSPPLPPLRFRHSGEGADGRGSAGLRGRAVSSAAPHGRGSGPKPAPPHPKTSPAAAAAARNHRSPDVRPPGRVPQRPRPSRITTPTPRPVRHGRPAPPGPAVNTVPGGAAGPAAGLGLGTGAVTGSGTGTGHGAQPTHRRRAPEPRGSRSPEPPPPPPFPPRRPAEDGAPPARSEAARGSAASAAAARRAPPGARPSRPAPRRPPL
ncbi:basic proline-rich protein-like [Melozone crissalis]|uniref:basic proline-rich protein-like n=1 Tax=Melozone crissalis TaxID=40204 RepID=UPI0023DBCCF9|nr:basic proline-rich protein-like [Melozone crissalis]